MQVSTLDKPSGLLPRIRKEFPRAEADAHGRRRVFFDNAAGTLVLQRAVEAETTARRDYFPNVGEASWESKMNEKTILQGRKAVADFLNAPSETCITSGESATSLLFHLSYALSKYLSADENIVTTEYEHYANVSPWLELERRGVVREVRFAKFNLGDGILDLTHLESLLDSRTRVVAVSGVSNALGSKTPLSQIFSLARKAGAYGVLDAVHMAPHVPIDVEELQCDFAVFSAYKLFCRRGSFMFGRKELLEKLRPYKVGPQTTNPPTKWEMGTRDQGLFAAISAVMDYLSWLGSEVENEVSDRIGKYAGRRRLLKAALSWIEKYEKTLSEKMLGGIDDIAGMNSVKGVDIYGLKDLSRVDLRSPTFSFNVRGVPPEKVAEYMWEKHAVTILADDFYSRALSSYGTKKALRASLLHFNTIQEIQAFLTGFSDAVIHFSSAAS